MCIRDRAGTEREDRLRPVEGLYLAFLVHAQNDGFVWRVHIEPHNVPNLRGKVWIVAELERLHAMRLQFVSLPDPLHRRGTDLLRRSHGAHAPLRGVFRYRFHRGLHDGGFPLLGDPFGTPRSWTIFENSPYAVTFISLPPQQHRGHRRGQFPRKNSVGQPFRRTEDDIRLSYTP